MSDLGKPAPGDTAYLEGGQRVEVISDLGGDGWAVRGVYHDDEWGEPSGNIFTTSGPLWKEPPRALYEERIAELRAEVDALVETARTGRQERATFEREEQVMRERVRRHGLLEQIEAALENRITHVVFHSTWDNRVEVSTLAQALHDRDSRWRLKPLTLEAKREGEEGARLTWKVENNPADGLVFTSEADARAKAAEIVDSLFEAFRKAPKAEPHRLIGVIDSAKALGIEVPADLAERHRAHMEAVYRSEVERTERAVLTARAQLAPYLKGGAS